MVSRNSKSSPNGALPFQTGNKLKRQELFIKHKKAKESLKREERFRRKKEEDKDPRLRLERRKRNVPSTIDRKRTWDDFDSDNEDGLGRSVDVERIKKQKPEDVEEDRVHGVDDTVALKDQLSGEDDERDSMVDSSTDIEEDGAEEQETSRTKPPTLTDRATSPTRSTTSTNLSLMPEALAAKFPTLFTQEPRVPKVLVGSCYSCQGPVSLNTKKVTTSLNSTLHYEAELLTTLFPNSVYVSALGCTDELDVTHEGRSPVQRIDMATSTL